MKMGRNLISISSRIAEQSLQEVKEDEDEDEDEEEDEDNV